MGITVKDVEALAPDQASLKAASKLVISGKWPVLGSEAAGSLIWGECQGSGSNPYRVCADQANHGYKCTCPSRKFPCKHSLALMWILAEGKKPFLPAASAPDWVTDWVSRRKNPGAVTAPAPMSGGKKSISEALAEPENQVDEKAIVRQAAAAKKLAETTESSIHAATIDLELWIDDKLRTGLSDLMSDLSGQFRKIASRMVDGKASALASRLDEMPSRLLDKPIQIRADLLITELSKIVLLCRAWRADPQNKELRGVVGSGLKRNDVLEDPDNLRVVSEWEVLGERIRTRKDGLVSQATWLLNLRDEGIPFAVLQDYFPATAGSRSSAFDAGDQFSGELVFYPAKSPLRAIISDRQPLQDAVNDWPKKKMNGLRSHHEHLHSAPWTLSSPLYLEHGKFLEDQGGSHWWVSQTGTALPLVTTLPGYILGSGIRAAAGIWDGSGLDLIAAQSDLGRVRP